MAEIQQARNTSVFILAAGRGERMRPLTDTLPKPMLHVDGKSLLEHHLEKLAIQGFKDVVINVDYLADNIISEFNDGKRFGLKIRYSDERPTGALETAGGIIKALPLLKSNTFIVINSDIWTNFHYANLLSSTQKLATIVLVKNPLHNSKGDFSTSLHQDKTLNATVPRKNVNTYTYSGIGLYKKQLFHGLAKEKNKLAPLLYKTAEKEQLGALLCDEEWFDIGTPQRLKEINTLIKDRKK